MGGGSTGGRGMAARAPAARCAAASNMDGRGMGGTGAGGRIVDARRELRYRDPDGGLLGGDGATVQRLHGQNHNSYATNCMTMIDCMTGCFSRA